MLIQTTLPYGKITSVADLGQRVRARRRELGLTQIDLAALCGVGTRFISDLENGKPTAELGRALQVLACLGLDVAVLPRGWSTPEA